MALTLEQYVSYLDTRDLSWPAPPEIKPPRARPYLVRLPNVRAVTWNVYGTLLTIAGGGLYFQHPEPFVMEVALDKTIQEFKMWGSMTRKPGQPADYLREVYGNLLAEQQTVPGGVEKHPEVVAERLWEALIKRLLQKDYRFDTNFYGSLNEFSRKVAYFFHASLQGTACHAGAKEALAHVASQGLAQGVLADGQCFTMAQLQRGLVPQDSETDVGQLIDPELCVFSYELRARKPSERLFRQSLSQLAERGIAPEQVLHVGSRLLQDLAPARRLGMRTALFAGDKGSLQADPRQLREPATRPDVLLTELGQIDKVIG
jgi:hypothetical protein